MMTPSTFHPVSSMHCYRPTMSSHESDNPPEDNQPEYSDDNPLSSPPNTEHDSQG